MAEPVGEIQLPAKVFYYTLDQIAHLLRIPESDLRKRYVWLEGHSMGRRDPKRMRAVNFTLDYDDPDWRIEEQEFKRFCKILRIKVR